MTEERRQSTDPLLKQIHDDLQNIKALQEAQKIMLEEVKEIVSAWNNAKGFVKTVKVIGDVLKWAVAFGAAVAAVYYWMKR